MEFRFRFFVQACRKAEKTDSRALGKSECQNVNGGDGGQYANYKFMQVGATPELELCFPFPVR